MLECALNAIAAKRPAARGNATARCAITLIELLVVLGAIGILLTVTLPAIQAARGAARRSQCTNQLRQFALAALDFESARKRVPGGTGFFSTAQTPLIPKVFHGQGWIVEILPELGQQGLADTFAGYRTREHSSNPAKLPPDLLQAVQTQPPGFACPADDAATELITTQYQWEDVPVAPTNYRGVVGSNLMSEGTNSFPVTQPRQASCIDGRTRCNGMIWRTSAQYPVRLKEVGDGLSKTMMVGEDLPSHNWHTMWSFSNGDSSSTLATLNYSLYHPDPRAWWDMRGFRSYHPGGAHFAFGDGAVHFIEDGINFTLYQSMSTIAEQDCDEYARF